MSTSSHVEPEVAAGFPAGRGRLADSIRDLIEATVLADGSTVDLDLAAERIAAVTEDLRAGSLDSPLLLVPLAGVGELSVNNPVEGPGNPLAPPLTGIRIDGGTVHGTAAFGLAHEGAPGRVHGGWVAALLDHAVGRAAAVGGPAGMTASLTVEYHEGTPYGVPLDVEAEVTRREGRKVYAVGKIRTEGRTIVTASALLITVNALSARVAVDQE
jgi:hypothetical protein